MGVVICWVVSHGITIVPPVVVRLDQVSEGQVNALGSRVPQAVPTVFDHVALASCPAGEGKEVMMSDFSFYSNGYFVSM